MNTKIKIKIKMDILTTLLIKQSIFIWNLCTISIWFKIFVVRIWCRLYVVGPLYMYYITWFYVIYGLPLDLELEFKYAITWLLMWY